MASRAYRQAVMNLAPEQWQAIRDPACTLVVDRRSVVSLQDDVLPLLDQVPFERIGSGEPAIAVAELGHLSARLAADIRQLAYDFGALMAADLVRIRLEGAITNACRKIHADNTDLRLITTYAGPATQILPQGAEPLEEHLWQMEAGWIGLFKGLSYGEGHSACLHRSPPAGDWRAKRLLLVIDTPAFPALG